MIGSEIVAVVFLWPSVTGCFNGLADLQVLCYVYQKKKKSLVTSTKFYLKRFSTDEHIYNPLNYHPNAKLTFFFWFVRIDSDISNRYYKLSLIIKFGYYVINSVSCSA